MHDGQQRLSVFLLRTTQKNEDKASPVGRGVGRCRGSRWRKNQQSQSQDQVALSHRRGLLSEVQPSPHVPNDSPFEIPS